MADQNDDVTPPSVSAYSSSSWLRGKVIGRGSFGTVTLAVKKSDGKIFAVKSVERATCLPAQLESLENEIRILRCLSSDSSPHVVGFLGDDDTREGTASFRNLHLEYMPLGTVADVAGHGLDEQLVRRFTWCLVSALWRVHRRGFVHCDVKARNVLLGDGPSSAVKLADFGSGMEIPPGGCAGSRDRIVPRGSPLWMAPEVIRREYQGPESDVWSLGCTVIEIVTGKPPWQDSEADTLRTIGLSDEMPSFPTRLSELGRDFLGKCLSRDPSERWSCDQLLQHPFLSSYSFSGTADSSPRCVLDWVDSAFEEEEGESAPESNSNFELLARGRIGKLAAKGGAIWESDGWLAVRGSNYEEEETRQEFPGSSSSVYCYPAWPCTRAERELQENSVSGSQGQHCNFEEYVGPKLGPICGPRGCGFGPRNAVTVLCKLLLSLCWLQRFTYDLLWYNLYLFLFILFVLLSFFILESVGGAFQVQTLPRTTVHRHFPHEISGSHVFRFWQVS